MKNQVLMPFLRTGCSLLLSSLLVSGAIAESKAPIDATQLSHGEIKQQGVVEQNLPTEVNPELNARAKSLPWDTLRPPIDQELVARYRNKEVTYDEINKYLEIYNKQVVADLDGQFVKMPGYLVPLNMTSDMRSTEFLLVPTMGACVHLPPPPANQIVHIIFKEGLAYEETASVPYWVYGELKTEKKTSRFSDAMYSMKAEQVLDYRDSVEYKSKQD